jgi:uncharacterized membrane protein (DUF485 family)
MDKYTSVQKTALEVLASPEFKRLVRTRWIVSGILCALLFASYYGYILVLGLDKALLSRKIGAVTTLGIPVGIGVIVFAVLLTAVYVIWANAKYDPEVDRLRDELRKVD